jgi:hypothetical protein
MNSENTCLIARQNWTWKDRLLAKLFPFVPCHAPEVPASFQDVLIVRTRCSLDFIDRIKVLFTGKVEVETRTATTNLVGDCKTNSVVRAGRFWS